MAAARVTEHKKKRELSRKKHKKSSNNIYLIYNVWRQGKREKIEVRSEEV
jgi:hypothetical protein